MATTTVDVNTQLISSQSIGYIRPITLQITCVDIRPNTRLYAWFDDTEVTRYISANGGALGDPIVSDANGKVVGTFAIPGKTFTTGTKTLTLNEIPTKTSGSTDPNFLPDSPRVPIYADPNVSYTIALGQITGSASAQFISTGIKEIFQTTQTTTNTTVVEQVVRIEDHVQQSSRPRGDPLAETFFTTGMTDGIYITSIELYFKDKDQNLPIWVELRETSVGFPIDTLVAPWATATVNASDVVISDTATAATKFTFPKMVYLKPDSDYSFVIQTRSNKYNAWTSKMGERSKETGNIVYDQPYKGSLLKSENNYTWVAEETEDVKFKLNRASFNTGVGTILKFPLKANSMYVDVNSFYTVQGTDLVFANFTFKHGLDVNSKIAINCDPTGLYNGVSGTLMAGSFLVTQVLSDNVIAFNIGNSASFTSSSWLTTGQRVTDIQVTNGGSGYSTSSPPTINISAPGSGGVQAVASPVIVNGQIDYIKITTPGTKYATAPTITITGGAGSGANAFALINDKFTVTTNRIYHGINPSVSLFTPSSTTLNSNLATTLGKFENGAVTQYSTGKTYNIDLNKHNQFDNNLLLVSKTNEVLQLGSNSGAMLTVNMNTTSDAVSPVIDLDSSRMYYDGYLVNMQTGSQRPMESITSTNTSGSVITGTGGVTITSGGSGYLSGGSGTISGTNITVFGTGTGAVATATVTSGVITSVNVTSGGSGFVTNPQIIVAGGTTSANITAAITNFNSELAAGGGQARAKYFTKQVQLVNASTGIRLYANAYSNVDSSFEVYIRTSSSSTGVDHTTQPWQQLKCDTTRNKSTKSGQIIEYPFYLDNITSFDVYTLKLVLRSNTPWDPPVIRDYRAIILAR